jgi:hypothetical protein
VNYFRPRTTDGTDGRTNDSPGQSASRGIARKLVLALALAVFSYVASRGSKAVQK